MHLWLNYSFNMLCPKTNFVAIIAFIYLAKVKLWFKWAIKENYIPCDLLTMIMVFHKAFLIAVFLFTPYYTENILVKKILMIIQTSCSNNKIYPSPTFPFFVFPECNFQLLTPPSFHSIITLGVHLGVGGVRSYIHEYNS